MKLSGSGVVAIAGLLAVAGVVLYARRKVAVAVREAGQVAYSAGDSIQDAIIPGAGTLGTAAYEYTHNDDGSFNWQIFIPGYSIYRLAANVRDGMRSSSTPVAKPAMTYSGYPGGASYPARITAAIGYNNDQWLPDYLKGLQ